MRRANTAKDKPETTMTRFFIAGIAALVLMATGTAHAAGVDYICGDYSIVVEPKNRTYQSFDGHTQTTSTVTVNKGIKIFDANGRLRTVKTLARNKSGKVAVHGIPCRKVY
jgi:hypothetical protein